MKKGLLIFTCIISALLIGFFANMISTSAYDEKAGYVNDDQVNVRSGAGTNYSNVMSGENRIQLYTGHEVTVIDETLGTDGMVWYNISFVYSEVSYTGYMRSDFINISNTSSDYTFDGDFEEYLDSQGFPESYKPYLRELHEKYPNWVFIADEIDYNWSDVVEAESVVGRSLVSYGSISSYKSVETGAYNWSTAKWNYFDGTAWAAASEELVAYSLDPRNFLDEKYIFQFETLSYQSGFHNLAGIKSLVEGTFLNSSVEGTTYSDIFLAAANQSGVSPYYLVASVLQEQGVNGGTGLISGTYSGYTGYYNFFNYGAYAANGNSATVNGLIYAMGTDSSVLRPWNSRYKSIVGGAIKTGNGYINIGQDTIYYKKFDFIGTPYTHQYMTHILGAKNEGLIMGSGYSSSMKSSLSLTFKIPVYKNMPATACKIPTETGSPNNVLSSLSINGYSLTPSFDKFTSTYNVIVPNDTSSITISASKVDSTASVSGTGQKSISVGNNNFKIVVTAENGDKRTYQLNVVREATVKNTQTIKEGSTFSTNYDLNGDTISGIPIGTTAGNAKNEMAVTGCTYMFTDKEGNETSGSLGTGSKCVIYDEGGTTKLKEYEILIYGDANGDGLVTSLDMLYIKRHILGIKSLEDIYADAANVSKGSEGITSLDMLYIKRQILGISSIAQ